MYNLLRKMSSGYKKFRSRPRQRDNYIDPTFKEEEPPTRKLLKPSEPYIKTKRIENML